MRIITDGKRYAVAKGRWIFTKVMSKNGFWWKPRDKRADEFDCWTDLDNAKCRMENKKKIKWWDYKEEKVGVFLE